MSGTPSSQPGETTKVPESRTETRRVADGLRVPGGEVVTNGTQEGRDLIAALLADTIDSETSGTSIG